MVIRGMQIVFHFFFNDMATTEIYTLSLHDALPICCSTTWYAGHGAIPTASISRPRRSSDRKSTRLNSSHEWSSYAVFCLKKKKKKYNVTLFITKKKKTR